MNIFNTLIQFHLFINELFIEYLRKFHPHNVTGSINLKFYN